MEARSFQLLTLPSAKMGDAVCSIHFAAEQNHHEQLIKSSDNSLATLKNRIEQWKDLDGEEAEVAQSLNDKYGENLPLLFYHRRCYMKFTNINRLKLANRRSEKRKVDKTTLPVEGPSGRKSHRKALLTGKMKNSVLFPSQCIICGSDKYITEAFSRKRLKEPLCLCQTPDACSQLKESAHSRQDERLLVIIRDMDLIAREAKYHKSCYRQYIRSVNSETLIKKSRGAPGLYEETFSKFCTEVVESEIINEKAVYRLSKLSMLFNNMISNDHGQGDNSFSFTSRQLKKKLKSRYPNLLFHSISKRESDIVLCSEENEPVILDTSAIQDSSDDSNDCESDGELEKSFRISDKVSDETNCRRVFTAAQLLKQTLLEAPKLDATWPPTGKDFNEDKILKMIPHLLYNFISWLIGASEEVELDPNVRVEIDPVSQKRVLAIAQDLIFSLSKGKKLTPKHLALGMTIRHLTGSSKVINLLNGLGHSVSHPVVLEHDTAIARMILKNQQIIPCGFLPETFTILVWDNIDFGEETLSGRGTTHSTNGIIIQPDEAGGSQPCQRIPANNHSPVKKDKSRTIESQTPCIIKYTCGKKEGPEKTFAVDELSPEVSTHSKLDIAYVCLHLQKSDESAVPGWTGFNTLLASKPNSTNKIGYLTPVNASPTDMSTVYTLLKRSVDIADELQIPNIVLVFDQAIYCKAQQIRWKDDLFKHKLVIRLGEFHTVMSYLSILGKRFKDAGLKDVLIESGLVAQGSIKGVMNGHHYNRSLRSHKIMFEALSRLVIQQFLSSLSAEMNEKISLLLESLQYAFPETKYLEIVYCEDFNNFCEMFKNFADESSRKSDTFSFWWSYIEMVQNLLLFLRASREGDWNLHLSSVRSMLPWFFAYDRVNYARYLPIYLLEMLNLKETHPFVHEHLMKGEFVVKRSIGYGFAGTPCDQVIEQTANRDSKSKGGLTGISINKSAVHRWILTHPARSEISSQCEFMAERKRKSRGRRDLDGASINKHKVDIDCVVSTVESMCNPFCLQNDGLVNISNGSVASTTIRNDLLKAHGIGESAYLMFQKNNILGEKKIFDKLKCNKLKTFSHSTTVVSLPQNQTLSLKMNTDLLTRMVVIGQNRSLDINEILSYNLAPYPPAFSTFDGIMLKTDKSKLMNHIKSLNLNALLKDGLDSQSSGDKCLIVDGMAVIQQQRESDTFGQFAEKVLSRLSFFVKQVPACKRVDFVVDRYPENSIKGTERSRRAKDGISVVKIFSGSQKMPKQFQKYISSGKNKEELVEFLFKHWSSSEPSLFRDFTIFVTHGKFCHSIKQVNNHVVVTEITELFSDHQEADTRMFLHAKHASVDSKDIIIRSADTDVFILSLYLCDMFDHCNMFLQSFDKDAPIVHINQMVETVGLSRAKALIGFHNFTGCDTVSCMKGRGKIKPLKIIWDSDHFIQLFSSFGSSWEMEIDIDLLEVFICELYGKRSASHVNEARVIMFRLFQKSELLPPNKDSLLQHARRANYQTCIQKSALSSIINAPPPTSHGWEMSGQIMVIQWGTQPFAPAYLLENIHCSCKLQACATNKCSCHSHNIPCTDQCKCQNCENTEVVSEPEDEESEDESDED